MSIIQNFFVTGSSPTSAIVTSGLILNLDAGDALSYPGSGTTWYDLSGSGYNATLVNGASYSSSNGGIIYLSGDTNPSGASSSPHISFSTAILSGRSELSIGMWVYLNSGNSGGNYWAEGGTLTTGTFPETWWQFNLISTNNWYTRDSSTGETGARNNDLNINYVSPNTWTYITAVYSVSSSIKAFYVNGSLSSSTSTSIDTLTTGRNPFQSFIGRPTDTNDPSDNYLNGYISNVQVYNRAINTSEMLQNYNAFLSRF